MHALLLTIAAVPTILGLWWFIFGTWARFLKALEYAITPDLFSWFTGRGPEDVEHTLRLLSFIFSAAALVYVEHVVIAMVVG
jgi:hypothetical protein